MDEKLRTPLAKQGDPPTKKKNLSKIPTSASSAKVMNGHIYNISDIKTFYDKMLSSDWYKNRLLNNGYGLEKPDVGKTETKLRTFIESSDAQSLKVNNLIKNRRAGVKTVDVTVDDNDSTYYWRNGIRDPYVNVGPSQLKELRAHPRSALTHEIGHAEIDEWHGTAISGYEKQVYNDTAKPLNKIRSDDGTYVLNPDEAKGDINTLRYNLYKSGDFNPSTGEYKTKDKKFNKELLPKIKNDYNTKRMIDAYGEEGVSTLMNTIAKNKKQNAMQYMANGGVIRPSSKQRHIWGAVIGSALGTGASVISGMIEKKKQRELQNKQEQQSLQSAYFQKSINDTISARDYDPTGDENVEYYAKGGKINKLLELPSIGGYKAKGGNLVPIADGVEQVVGNRHNETTIDGVSGVQLSQNGEPVAEVEDNEVIVDGNQVLSDRLKYDKNNTYADKMRTLARKRNKLESQQERLNSSRTKNTIERKLAGLNAAEDALFKHQETHKLMEGKKVLDNLNTFAYGGSMIDPPVKRNFMFPRVENGKYKNWYQAPNGFINSTNPKVMVDLEGNPTYDYEKMNMPAINNTTPVSDNLEPLINPVAKEPILSTPALEFNTPPGTNTDTVAKGSDTDSTKKGNFLNSSLGQGITDALPGVISGIGAIAMAGRTPKLPTPLLNAAVPLATRVNVNPQLANIRGSVKSTVDNILGNTSNSNNAKANIVSTRLRGASEINNVLANKENQEVSLRNADSQNRQMVNNANTATMNQHNMNQYQRLNDIRSMKSAGFNQILGAVQNGLNIKRTANNFNSYINSNLMDDALGEKLDIFLNNPEFMSNPDNIKFINSILKNRKK